jgi:hypothetical protein
VEVLLRLVRILQGEEVEVLLREVIEIAKAGQETEFVTAYI